MNNMIIPTSSHAWWFYKLRASLISLGISVVFISLLAIVLLTWLYPEWFLFEYDGGWQGLRIVMGVDLVLGPLIAFVIFSPNKARHLILLDIAIISIIQLSAFVWGCYALWTQHPLALSYFDGSFHSITFDDLKTQKATREALTPYDTGNKPILIYTKATTPEAAVAEVIEMITLNISPYARIENYHPIKEHLSEVFDNQLDRKQILEKESPGALEHFSKKHNVSVDALRLVPMTMRTHNAMIFMDENADILGAIPVSANFEKPIATVKTNNNSKK